MKGIVELCLLQSNKIWFNYHQNIEQKYNKSNYTPEISILNINNKQVLWLKYKSIDSTMIPAEHWNSDLVTPGRCFVFQCEEQTSGLGQGSNKWNSPPGNLYMTVLTEINSALMPLLSILAGSAVTQTIYDFVPEIQVKNKWINDIFIKDFKVGGLLTKCSLMGTQFFGIFGIGINIGSNPIEGSTCLNKQGLKDINVSKFSQKLIDNLMKALSNKEQSLARFKKDLAYLGQQIVIYDSTLTKIQHRGFFKGINDYGHAIITQNEKETIVMEGRMRKIKPSINQPHIS